MGLFDLMNTAKSFMQSAGDELNMKRTDNNRFVVKSKHENTKYSITEYPNGTTVETYSVKRK